MISSFPFLNTESVFRGELTHGWFRLFRCQLVELLLNRRVEHEKHENANSHCHCCPQSGVYSLCKCVYKETPTSHYSTSCPRWRDVMDVLIFGAVTHKDNPHHNTHTHQSMQNDHSFLQLPLWTLFPVEYSPNKLTELLPHRLC